MKRMRKVTAVLVGTAMTVGLLTGCGSAEGGKTETVAKTEQGASEVQPVTIACGWASIGEQELLQQQYYEEILGPGLNIEFIFSPILSSDEEIIDFLENASAQGAVGFMDMASSSPDSANIVAEKCDELGMYIASWMPGAVTDTEYFVGMASADGNYMSTAFYEMLTEELKEDQEKHSMLVFSNNASNYTPKHLYTTVGALSAFNDMYELGWTEDEMNSFAVTQERLYVDTGSDDVKICIEPGLHSKDINEVCGEILKNGDYDVVVFSDSNYLQATTAIAEAEQALNKDLKVYCNSNIISATQAAFDTKDNFENSSLNQAMLKTSANGAVLMAILLNGVYEASDAVYDVDGNYKLYNIRFMRASSADDYARIAKIDHDGHWMFSLEDFKQMLKPFNEQVTSEWLQTYINDNVGFEAVMERLGL